MEILFENDLSDHITIILKINFLNATNKTEKIKINMSKGASKNTSIHIFNQRELRWNLLFEDSYKYTSSSINSTSSVYGINQNPNQNLEQKNAKITEYIQNVYKILY